MSNNHYQEESSVIDSLLPWSETLPERCHLKTRYKKCLKNDVDIITENPLFYTTPWFEALTYNTLGNTSISVIYDLFIKYQRSASQTP